jgi:2-dehydro-3-deoxygalactonokinase
MPANFIALDWGTTSFRAYLVAADGSISDSRASPDGILSVANAGFEPVLERQIGSWDKGLPVLASGMITSRQGWHEVPYAIAPAGLPELAAGLTSFRTVSGRAVAFVPGVSFRDAAGVPDVIRGEETQVVGAASGGSGLFVTRGTHCKWIEVVDGRITRFATFMTGELFAVLKDHSILGRLMTAEAASGNTGFALGVGAGLESGAGAGLLHTLFSVRTLGLFGDISADQLSPYLSGLLLGAEIAAARQNFQPGPSGITVIGAPTLAEPFIAALSRAGIASRFGPADAAVRGLAAIAKHAGVLA